MDLGFKIQPDLQKLSRNLTGDVRGAKRAGMINLAASIEARARRNAPVKTANLANTGTNEVNADGTQGTVSFTAPYAGHVHQGTGLYGPHRTKIVPRGKRALYWPGAAHPVRSVKGMKGRPFLMKAAEESDMERLFTDGANNYLQRQQGES